MSDLLLRGTRIEVTETHRDGSIDLRSIDVQPLRSSRNPAPVDRTPPTPKPRRSVSSPTTFRDSSPTRTSEPYLIETNDVVMFAWDEEIDKFSGDIYIKNVSDDIVAFKLKSTSMSYQILPGIGMIAPGAEGTVKAIAYGAVDTSRHKFQVLAASIPADLKLTPHQFNLNEAEPSYAENFAEVNSLWKRSIQNKVPMQTKKLRVSIEPRRLTNTRNHSPQHATPLGNAPATWNEADYRRRLAELESNMTCEAHERVERAFRKQVWLLGLILAFVLLFGIMIYSTSPSEVKVHEAINASGSCPGSPCSPNPSNLPESSTFEASNAEAFSTIPQRVPEKPQRCAAS